jgi:4-hydroxyphenylpyruvate dioxygenase
MGPFPHDAPPARISAQNPAGTDGFEFVEFAHSEPEKLEALFGRMGYVEVARHKTRNISLYRQGGINYLLNRDPISHAARFVAEHGPCAPAMAWRVVDARHALKRALDLGAKEYTGKGKSLDVPAVIGIGGSLLYFVDRYGAKGSPYADEYRWLGEADPAPKGVGFFYLDHLTHNVMRGNMDTWYRFYAETFNFREIRFFNIEGKLTGPAQPGAHLALRQDSHSDQRERRRQEPDRGISAQYKGEGIQHIAVGTDDIYAATDAIARNGLAFMPGPPRPITTSRDARARPPGADRAHEAARHPDRRRRRGRRRHDRILLQIFSKTVIGPIFFEFIQRKGDDGFGEGNFKALFESIEEDQIQRGVLKAS